MPAARSAFTIHEHPAALRVSLHSANVSPASINELGETLTQLIARPQPPNLVIDLTDVEFMPTAMLGHLIVASTRLRLKERRLRLVGVNSHIAGVFDVTRMKDHFDFHPTIESALASFGA